MANDRQFRASDAEPDAAPVTRSTALPAISIGFAISVAAGFWFVGEYRAELNATVTALEAKADRNTSRFNQYSGSTGSNTLEIRELHDRLELLEKELSVLHETQVGR